MKIVVLDGYTLNPGDLSWDRLERIGSLTVHDRTSADKIVERIADAEIVLTNKTPLTRATFFQLSAIKYVGLLATGYNVVDIDAANELGVTVTNVPTYGTDAVSQFTFALVLELCHHVGTHNQAVKRGEWINSPDWCFWNYPLVELAGKTMGIICFGRIGQATARIADAFGMKVLVYDRCPDKDLVSENQRYVALDELLAGSDIISLHCPLVQNTAGIINKDTIAGMKTGVMIINTARGPLIVEEDLAEALNKGKVAGAAVDVVSVEPIRPDNPLLSAKNCIITPHIAWAAMASRKRLMDVAVDNVEAFLEGTPVNVVNQP